MFGLFELVGEGIALLAKFCMCIQGTLQMPLIMRCGCSISWYSGLIKDLLQQNIYQIVNVFNEEILQECFKNKKFLEDALPSM